MRPLLRKVGGAGLLLLAGACSNTGADGTAHTDGVGGGGSDSNASSGGGTRAQDTGAGGTSSTLCGWDPRMQCAVDCDFFDCGAPTSGFDENGCLREECVDDRDCPLDERCAGGAAGAGGEGSEVCVTVWSSCSPDENGHCSCRGGAVCEGYCVPK